MSGLRVRLGVWGDARAEKPQQGAWAMGTWGADLGQVAMGVRLSSRES